MKHYLSRIDKSYKQLFSFWAIILLGMGLRFYKWNSYSLWCDEAQWIIIGQSLRYTLEHCIYIGKPPFFGFFLNVWRLLGASEFILRLPSVCFGILSIWIVYEMAKKFFSNKIALIASFLVSISPLHIYYSQELTHYSLTVFLVLCSIYFMQKSLEKESIKAWGYFIFFTALSLYTNYISLFILAAENIFYFSFIKRYKSLIKKWFFSQCIILLIYLPWLIMIPKQFYALSVEPINWIPRGSLLHIFQALCVFSAGYNADFFINSIALLVYIPLLCLGFISSKSHHRGLLTIWLFLPMVISILTSHIQPTFTYRNFILSLPAYYLLVATGVAKAFKSKKYIYSYIILFIAVSSFSLFNYYRNIFPYPEYDYRLGVHAKKDNKGASNYIINNFKQGDFVIHTCQSTIQPFFYYFFYAKRRMPLEKDLARGGNDYTIIEDEKELPFIIRNKERIWLVLSSWDPHELETDLDRAENRIKDCLDDTLGLVEMREFTGIKVYLYDAGIVK